MTTPLSDSIAHTLISVQQWAECTAFSIAAGINITVAVIAYVWIQKPYVLQQWVLFSFLASHGK